MSSLSLVERVVRRAVVQTSLLAFLLIGRTTRIEAAELRISAGAFERFVASQFFTTAHQRHYLSGDENSRCEYAYLESPRAAMRGGRILMTVGLRARKAAEIAGNCVGPGDSRDITFSALPFFENGSLGLKDIQLEAISGLSFPAAEGLIGGFIKGAVPSSFHYDFRSDLQKGISTVGAPQGVRLSLPEFVVRSIRAESNVVVCTFDFAFEVVPR